MNHKIIDGVYPTMITPFTDEGKIDFAALESLISWYWEKGVDGLFAVCQSSAMFELSLKERITLAEKVVELNAGRGPVLASGHVADTLDDQIYELLKMLETGVDALVLVSNRLAEPFESDDLWKFRLEKIFEALPEDTKLGLYECPSPYKRLISTELLAWLANTGRIHFIKDTCCDPVEIVKRGSLIKGTPLKLFNANAATLLHSLQSGYSGYSGIMTNFHTDLYYWLCHNWNKEPERAKELQAFLGLASIIEYQRYPLNAKYMLQLEGLPIGLRCRRSDAARTTLSSSMRFEIEQFAMVSHLYSERFRN